MINGPAPLRTQGFSAIPGFSTSFFASVRLPADSKLSLECVILPDTGRKRLQDIHSVIIIPVYWIRRGVSAKPLIVSLNPEVKGRLKWRE